MKRKFKLIICLLGMCTFISSCSPVSNDNDTPSDTDTNTDTNDNEDTNFHKVTSKKIEKQWTLDYDWTYSYYNMRFVQGTIISSTSQLKSSNNSFIKTTVENQFRGKLSESHKDFIGYDPFEEYNDKYFEDHVLILGLAYLTKGATLYTNGIGKEPIEYYATDSNGNKVLDSTFTPFQMDHIYETKPSEDEKKYLTLYIYDEFKISESQFAGKTSSEVRDILLGDTKNKLVYYYFTIYKDEYNKEHPDYKID